MARGGVEVSRASGVSDGVGEVFFFGLGESEPDGPFPAATFLFFFPFGEASFDGDFFAFGFGVASGVSLGFADASASSAGVFLALDFGVGDVSVFLGFDFFLGEAAGEVAFFFFAGEVFGLGVGVGVSSAE